MKCSALVESGPTMRSCTTTLPQVCRQSERSPFHLSYSCAHAVMRCMYVPLTVTRRLCSGYVQTPMSTCKCEHWGSRRTDGFLSIARARPSLITTVANVRAGRCNRHKILLYEVTSSSDKTLVLATCQTHASRQNAGGLPHAARRRHPRSALARRRSCAQVRAKGVTAHHADEDRRVRGSA